MKIFSCCALRELADCRVCATQVDQLLRPALAAGVMPEGKGPQGKDFWNAEVDLDAFADRLADSELFQYVDEDVVKKVIINRSCQKVIINRSCPKSEFWIKMVKEANLDGNRNVKKVLIDELSPK